MFGSFARLAPTLALLAGVAAIFFVGAPGPGYKYGFIELGTIFQGLKYGAYVGLAAGALGILAILLRLVTKQGAMMPALVGIVLGVAAVGFVENFRTQAAAVPPIHDITTDTDNPPAFVATVALREAANAVNPPHYVGDEPDPGNPDRTIREAQLAHYTDLGPLVLDAAPDAVFSAAQAVVEELSWELVAANSDEGRIEAVVITAWYGFKDDVVIRIAAQSDGTTRVDVRSKSRIGVSDIGANAARIQVFLDGLSAQMGN